MTAQRSTARRSTARRRVLLRGVVLALVALTGLAGCTWGSGGSAAAPSASARNPSEADLRTLESRIETLDHVTSARLRFFPATVEDGASYEGAIRVDTSDKAQMVAVLKDSWKVVWDASEIRIGALSFAVTNPASGVGVGYRDTDVGTNPSSAELSQLFGPRPTSPT